MQDLEIERENQPRYRYLANLCQNWIKYNNHYDEATRVELLNALSNRQYRFLFVKSAFKYFIDNVMIKLSINETNNPYLGLSFSVFDQLENNWLFVQLLNWYGFKFDDLFMKRKVYVCDEDTKVSQLVLNNKIYKTMSLDNFTNNQKIIKYPNNRMAIVDKDINVDDKQPLLTTVFMPSTMLLKASLDKHVVLPSNWYSNDYDPFKTNGYFDSSPVKAMWLIDGLKDRLISLRYDKHN